MMKQQTINILNEYYESNRCTLQKILISKANRIYEKR